MVAVIGVEPVVDEATMNTEFSFMWAFEQDGCPYVEFYVNERSAIAASAMKNHRPYQRMLVRDLRPGEASPYWAWWSTKQRCFEFCFASKLQLETCFEHGTRVLEQNGAGKVVNVHVSLAELIG